MINFDHLLINSDHLQRLNDDDDDDGMLSFFFFFFCNVVIYCYSEKVQNNITSNNIYIVLFKKNSNTAKYRSYYHGLNVISNLTRADYITILILL